MKLLHVIDSLGKGGAETLLVNVITNLPQFNHVVVILHDINEFRAKLSLYDNIKVISLNTKSHREFFGNVRKLKYIIRQTKPDIIHSHLFWSNNIAKLATPVSIPFFFTNHSLQSYSTFKKKWLILLEKLAYSKRHTLISVSKTVEEEYKKIIGIKGKHYVLINMAEDIFFKSSRYYHSKDQLKFITAGRLHAQKNQSFLLKSFSHLSERYTLDIYGKGPLQKELEILKSRLQLENVTFKGVAEDLEKVFPEYDVFIMSSLYEGFSIAVIEAMACGLPVFLPDLPVFKEMGGDAAIYINLKDEYSIKNELEKLDQAALNTLSRKSFERAMLVGNKKNYLDSLLKIYGLTHL